MLFATTEYLVFFGIILTLYWMIPMKSLRNLLLLAGSYLFYGWIHPWFCILIAVSTVVDYLCALGMQKYQKHYRVWFLALSLVTNLGMLGWFKYFNFFASSVESILESVGYHANSFTLQIALPVGLSFYTFQSLSYTIDVYLERLEVRKNFVDFALFVSMFPQLVAGPIERASHLLPQIESKRRWNWDYLNFALPLLVRGFFKKLVVADNVAIYADQVFMLSEANWLLLLAGSLAFAVQIYADFSAYTDIARGSAKLLGFDLMENFNAPYLAITPSDFWRRWHISFSSWIRDYLYIPLGGSNVQTKYGFFAVVMTTMSLSGLWHGASWNFVLWGVYHGLLLFTYHQLGCNGKWQPRSRVGSFMAWATMFVFTIFGWLIFRTPDVAWLVASLGNGIGANQQNLIVFSTIAVFTALYSLPLLLMMFLDRWLQQETWRSDFVWGVVYGGSLMLIVLMHRDSQQDFIYFRF